MRWNTHCSSGQRGWNKVFPLQNDLNEVSSVKYSSSVSNETLMTFLYISFKWNFLKEILVKTCAVSVFTCWHGVTFQNTWRFLQNVPVDLEMGKQVHPKCLNPPQSTAWSFVVCGWAVTVNSIRLIDCMGFCCVWLSCYCEQYEVNWLHGLLLCMVELLLCTV